MFSPIDKRQEHKLLPVECQQDRSFIGFAGGYPFPDISIRQPAVSPVFGLTNILGTWQHTLATSVQPAEF